MYLGDTEKKKVNSALLESYEKVLYEIEKEEETIISSFDRDIEKILGKTLLNYLIENNYIKVKYIDGKVVGDRVLENFHFSDIPSDHTFIKPDGSEISIGEYYKERVSKYLSAKTLEYKQELGSEIDEKKFNKNMPKILALASIGLTTFHRRRDMHLRDVQKLAGIGMCYGEIAELGTGEGKTVAAVLPAFMHALRGKGVHVVTANSYLSRRDFEELKPVYEGLGLSVGYVRSQSEENHDGLELKESKRRAYNCDITFSAKDEIAFDYLRDSTASVIEDVVTRSGKPGFAIIDEVDDALVDSASSPYIIAGTPPFFREGMTLKDIANAMALPLPKVTEQLELRGMDTDITREYSYEEVTRVAELFSKEIYIDTHDKLINAQTFYNIARFVKVNIDPEDMKVFDKYKDLFVMENGILRVHDKRLFRLLASSTTSDDSAYYFGKYKFTPDEIESIRKYTKIIVCPTTRQFYVTGDTLEEHMNLQFLSSRKMITYTDKYADKIKEELTIDEDYTISKKGLLRLTMKGFLKICNDSKYSEMFPEISDSYSELITNRNTMGSYYAHILFQCIMANELQKEGEDYIVRDGKIVLLRNAREKEGSNYSNGLHQAIEIKEITKGVVLTNENPSLASITQKDFYSRYELFCGMTGTSAHKIFQERYGKGTLEVPRAAFYDYFSKKLIKQKRNSKVEPRGVEKKKAVFAYNKESKFELIYKSILESKKSDPEAPVLIVVSDPKEIEELDAFLREKGIVSNVIETTRLGADKRKMEAIKIAKAGMAGMVTIATEMAGRGTDIKIGGDREMIIDQATDYMMKKCHLSEINRSNARIVCEEKLIKDGTIPTREKEEDDRRKLSSIGLKVISSGFFDSQRIDRQLEGRTGRNGSSGVTERYSCVEDLLHLGIDRVNGEPIIQLFNRSGKNIDGSVALSQKDYDKLMHIIEVSQNENDEYINESLKFAQALTEYTTKVMEKLRDKRRHLLELTASSETLLANEEFITGEVYTMLEDTIDSILVSFITNKDFDMLDDKVSKDKLEIDYEGLRLKCKEILGIDIDIKSIRDSKVSVLEVREALLNLAKKSHEKGLEDDREGQLRQDVNALLVASNNSLSRIHEREEDVRRQKVFDRMTLGETADLIAIKAISEMLEGLDYESSKAGVRILMGTVLTSEEKKELDKHEKELFDYRVDGEETIEPVSKQDDYKSIRILRKIHDFIMEDNDYDIERANKAARKKLKKNPDAEISYLYHNIEIRPMMFVHSTEGTFVLKKTLPTREDLLDSKKTI